MKASALLLTALTLLTGCVSTRYAPVQADSPPPSDVSVALCKAASAEAYRLAEGASCLFPVRADQKFTVTPLLIDKGETYRISVPRNQVWYDASRRNVAPAGDPGSWEMNRFQHWKRDDKSEWFALIAANLRPVQGSTSAQEPARYEHQESKEFVDVSREPELKVKLPGRLAFYPNDAIVPLLGDIFYSNNSGQVWVRITHCGAVCLPD
jgi:hypothetical protein